MPILLHIGSHKTGTTSIQRFLARHRDGLRQQGIWYPTEAELLKDGRDLIPHLNIARSLDLTGKPKPYSDAQLSEMAAALVQQSRDVQTTIISAEAFWRIGFGGDTRDGDAERIWINKQRNIARIRQLFGDADVKVVAVLRERVSHIQKGYSEFVLATSYHNCITRFVKQFSHIFDYCRQLEAWEASFPLQVLSYEDLCSRGSLPQVFTTALAGSFELPHQQQSIDPRFNQGHPIPCVLFKRYLNQIEQMPRDQRSRLYNLGRRRFDKALAKGKVSKFGAINSWLTARQIARLRRSYNADDEQIRSRFCPAFVSGPADRKAIEESGLTPLGYNMRLRVLGWMLLKQRPALTWFTPPTA
jgi:hypothetical protein